MAAICPHWVSFYDWEHLLVPAILKDCEPKANGEWWVTDSIEIGGGK